MNTNNNNNNLELSLLEHEIDALSSRYQIPVNANNMKLQQNMYQHSSQLNSTQQMLMSSCGSQGQLLNGVRSIGNLSSFNGAGKENNEGFGASAVKSPSVLTFGGTINNGLQQTKMATNVFERNPLQEQSMNKQNSMVFNGRSNGTQKTITPNAVSKINPKDLSNEELEFIIKTGQLPPRLQSQDSQQNPMLTQTSQSQFINNSSVTNNNLQSSQATAHQKTSQAMPLLQSYLVNPSNQYNDKENIQRMQGNQSVDYDQDQQKMLKNYNSPRMIPDGYVPMSSQNQDQQKQSSLLTAQIQPIALNLNALQQSSFLNPIETSIYCKGFEIQQPPSLTQSQLQLSQPGNQASSSQAASQALKALQDKCNTLTNQNQLLSDKLQAQEQQYSSQIHSLKQQLQDLQLQSSLKDQQMSEQLQSMQNEKLRVKEDCENDANQWREQYKKCEQENLILRTQLQEQMNKYQEIEQFIQEIKAKEKSLRDKCESEIESEKLRSQSLQEELDSVDKRYKDIIAKLQSQIKSNQDEYESERESLQKAHEREKDRIQRDKTKLQRELDLLKEELAILSTHKSHNSKIQSSTTHQQDKPHKPSKKSQRHLLSSGTPKAQGRQPSTARRCQSPQRHQQVQSHDNTVEVLKQYESIDVEEQKAKKKTTGRLLSAKRTGSVTKAKKPIGTQESQKSGQKVKKVPSTQEQVNFQAKNQHSERKTQRAVSSASKQSKRGKLQTSKSRQRNHSAQKKIKDSSLSVNPSQSNLISIDTKANRIDDYNLSSSQPPIEPNNNDLIYIQNNLSTTKFNQQDLAQNSLFNHLKRASQDSQSQAFNLMASTGSDFDKNLLFSQQSSIEPNLYSSAQSDLYNQQRQLLESAVLHNNNIPQAKNHLQSSKALDLKDITNNSIAYSHQVLQDSRQALDNEIFYLEREIFDLNQTYKSLLTQSTQPNTQPQQLNQKLRHIAQMLEDKSERLFSLKKQQQDKIMQQTLNPFAQSQKF